MTTNLLALKFILGQTSATYHTAPSGPLPFPNNLFPTVLPFAIGAEGVPYVPLTVSDSPAYDV